MLTPLKLGEISRKPLEFIVMSKITDNRHLLPALAMALVIALTLGVGILIGRSLDEKTPVTAAGKKSAKTLAARAPEETAAKTGPPAAAAPPVMVNSQAALAPVFNQIYQDQVYSEPQYYNTTVSGYPVTGPTPEGPGAAEYVYSNPPMDPPSTYGRKIGATP